MLPTIDRYTLSSQNLPPNTVRWVPDREHAALLVHDMQNYFVQAFNRAPGSAIHTAISNTARLIRSAHQHQQPVIYTAQPPQQTAGDRALLTDFWGPGLTQADDALIIPELAPTEADTVLTKWRYCAFYRTDLEERLRAAGKTQLWISGIYSHIGCQTTALTAFMRGFKVFFIADAQADFDAAYHHVALTYVASRCGYVTTTDQLLELS